MGLRGIAPIELMLVLLIVLVLFGGKRLRSLGGDLGGALRGFRSAMRDAPDEDPGAPPAPAGATDPLRPHAPDYVARSR